MPSTLTLNMKDLFDIYMSFHRGLDKSYVDASDFMNAFTQVERTSDPDMVYYEEYEHTPDFQGFKGYRISVKDLLSKWLGKKIWSFKRELRETVLLINDDDASQSISKLKKAFQTLMSLCDTKPVEFKELVEPVRATIENMILELNTWLLVNNTIPDIQVIEQPLSAKDSNGYPKLTWNGGPSFLGALFSRLTELRTADGSPYLEGTQADILRLIERNFEDSKGNGFKKSSLGKYFNRPFKEDPVFERTISFARREEQQGDK